ncbi:hypothetical protein ACIREO_16645 [Streptomyces sp. NPDC102441]|uniref:hypothetical protein n=1 Tax=Streptomyces sp. NPDC102441 TaxID=3366176 RepID=UPI0037FC7B7C
MTDQRSFARTVIALSLAVIACCALTPTIMLLTGSPAVQPQRVLDQDALARVVLRIPRATNSASFEGRCDGAAHRHSFPAILAVDGHASGQGRRVRSRTPAWCLRTVSGSIRWGHRKQA